MTKLIVRCDKCGKVLKGIAEKGNILGTCPRCREKFVIPDPVPHESRKKKRAVIGESRLVQPIPESLAQCTGAPVYRVMYTEVLPDEFIMKRSDSLPLLDLSEGGMGILMKADHLSGGLLPGDFFYAEIDFPILVHPVYIQVEVCWIRPIKDDTLLQVGVRFCEPGPDFLAVLNNLIQYIESRTQTIDFDKWGSFG
jgi:phage FluMu protein Com